MSQEIFPIVAGIAFFSLVTVLLLTLLVIAVRVLNEK